MQDHGLGGERFLFLCKVVQHAFDLGPFTPWVVMVNLLFMLQMYRLGL